MAELKEAMSASIFEAFIPLAQELKKRPDGEYLLAFALKCFFTKHRIERAQDREKAQHKLTEHERREHVDGHAPRHARGERGDRGEDRGERRGRRREREDARSSGEPQRDRGLEVVASGAPPMGVEEATEEGALQGRGRVFLALGEQDGADEGKVKEAVQALAPGLELLDVVVRRSHSFLFMKPEAVDAAVTSLDGKEWNGKRLGAERARRRRR